VRKKKESRRAYGVFLKFLSYLPRAWYFLALISILAASVELMAETLSPVRWLRPLRLFLVIAAVAILPFSAWPHVTTRQTNVDLLVKKLEASASDHDLIIVTPWYTGISFHWYYHGKAAWLTLPTMSDYRTHRYDLLKEKMMAPHPIDNVADAARTALKSGYRIWLVGNPRLLPPQEAPMVLPPAPNSPFRWQDLAYCEAWSQQLGAFLEGHANHADVVHIPTDIPVSEMENARLVIIAGWRD
jgi:hypothetical protein